MNYDTSKHKFNDRERFLAVLGSAPYPRRFRWTEHSIMAVEAFLYGVDDPDDPETPSGLMPLRRLLGWEESRLLGAVYNWCQRRGHRWLRANDCFDNQISTSLRKFFARPEVRKETDRSFARIVKSNREYNAQPVRVRIDKAKNARRVLNEARKIVNG